MSLASNNDRVLVVGSGIIGIGCAHYLSKAGFDVTVIDRGSIAAACSHANCGFILKSYYEKLVDIKTENPGLSITRKRGFIWLSYVLSLVKGSKQLSLNLY